MMPPMGVKSQRQTGNDALLNRRGAYLLITVSEPVEPFRRSTRREQAEGNQEWYRDMAQKRAISVA